MTRGRTTPVHRAFGTGRSGRRPFALAALLLSALGACRCQPGPVTPVDVGFRLAAGDEAVDFGRALEGSVVPRTITLIAETRVDVTVTLAVTAPFDAPLTLTVPGGDQAPLPLTFTAGNGRADGTLVLFANGHELRVALTGVGVRPPACVPSAPCLTSTYSLEQDRCVEAPAPDETACDPGSLCLERGRCRAGACVGVARTCDDANPCTVDACDDATGCVYRPFQCPAPTTPCRQAICDPVQGCGEVPAADMTPCGSVDCVSAHVCDQGTCTAIATPDGFHCADPLVCLGEGQCHQQKCERPDASVWAVEWSAPLGREVRLDAPALLSSGGNLYLVACDDEPLGSGGGDGGTLDAGDPVDAGSDDAGLDAGATRRARRCGLASWTGSGFERFTAYFDGGLERPWGIAGTRVVLFTDGGVRLRARTTGAVVGVLDEGTFDWPASLSARSDGALVGLRSLWDGGVELAMLRPDGGLERATPPLSAQAQLAHDERDGLWTWEPALGLLTAAWPDGGPAGAVALSSAGASLAVSRETAVVGASALVHFELDGGGVTVASLLATDAGPLTPDLARTLLGRGVAVTFHRRCEAPLTSCAATDEGTFARAFDATSGAPVSEVEVLPGGLPTALLDTALVDATPGTFVTVVRADLDGGPRAFLEGFAEGKRTLLCPFPGPGQNVQAALLTAGRLFVVLDERDGGHALEALPLTGLPLLSHGWARPGGEGNGRRATP